MSVAHIGLGILATVAVGLVTISSYNRKKIEKENRLLQKLIIEAQGRKVVDLLARPHKIDEDRPKSTITLSPSGEVVDVKVDLEADDDNTEVITLPEKKPKKEAKAKKEVKAKKVVKKPRRPNKAKPEANFAQKYNNTKPNRSKIASAILANSLPSNKTVRRSLPSTKTVRGYVK